VRANGGWFRSALLLSISQVVFCIFADGELWRCGMIDLNAIDFVSCSLWTMSVISHPHWDKLNSRAFFARDTSTEHPEGELCQIDRVNLS